MRNNASTEAAVCGHTIDQEIEMYLNSIETSTSSLLQYPNLVKAFLKYNDALLPSDAAVERLFSCARQILVPRWCKVSDEMFDKLVFLCYKLKQTVSARICLMMCYCHYCRCSGSIFLYCNIFTDII